MMLDIKKYEGLTDNLFNIQALKVGADVLSQLVSQLDFIQRDKTNNPQINRLYENAVKCLDKRVRDIHIPNNYFKLSLPLKEN